MILLHLSILARDMLIIPFIGIKIKRLFNITRNIITYRRSRLILITIETIIIIRYNKINNIYISLIINQNNQLTKSLLSNIKEGSSEDEDNKIFNLILKLDNNNNNNSGSSRHSSNSNLDSINSNSTLQGISTRKRK